MTMLTLPAISSRPAFPSTLPELPALRVFRERNGVRIATLLVVLGMLNGIDLAYTLFAHQIGMLQELNPLAAAYLTAGLMPSFVAYKLLMFLAGAVMLWRVRKSAWAGPACWLLVAVYAGLGVLWYEWVREVLRMYETHLALAF
ncbi:MAG TPA: DUF5658 family protein [Phycisphaerae bacterium]|nr:DUF5658 family protein [Phycisphaerae bacterium]